MNTTWEDLKGAMIVLLILLSFASFLYFEINDREIIVYDAVVIDKRYSTGEFEQYTMVLKINGYGVITLKDVNENLYYNNKIGDKVNVYGHIGNITGIISPPSPYR